MSVKLKTLGKAIFRATPQFKRYQKSIRIYDQKSVDEIYDLNNKRLAKLTKSCYEHIPYYHDLFNELGIRPEHVQDLDGLKKLPIMDKQTVRQYQDKLVPKNYRRFFAVSKETSGTSGTPIRVFSNLNSIVHEEAYLSHFRSKAGYQQGMRLLVLRGEEQGKKESHNGKSLLQQQFMNELTLPLVNFSDEDALSYLEKIVRFDPEAIYAMPSIAAIMARQCIKHNIQLNVKTILTSSERLSTSTRMLLEKTFGVHVFDWYGQTERVGAIGQCPYGRYHVMEDYSIMEFIDTPNGSEMVGTNLENDYMPLLRYRTNDIFTVSSGDCPCGRHGRYVTRIIGRDLGFIYGKSGQQYSFFLVSDSIDWTYRVEEIQYIQNKPGELIVKYKPEPSFTATDMTRMIDNIKRLTSNDVEVVLVQVDGVERSANGKVRDYLYGTIDSHWSETSF